MPDEIRKQYLKDEIEVIHKLNAGKENPFQADHRIFYFVAKKL
jgi:hypothetical protein